MTIMNFDIEGFVELIAREWAKDSGGRSPVERWQNKIRHLRRFLRGWANVTPTMRLYLPRVGARLRGIAAW